MVADILDELDAIAGGGGPDFVHVHGSRLRCDRPGAAVRGQLPRADRVVRCHDPAGYLNTAIAAADRGNALLPWHFTSTAEPVHA